jgi:hypothetical protein
MVRRPRGRNPVHRRLLFPAPARVLTASGQVVAVSDFIGDIRFPIPFQPDAIKNIFEKSRPGRPVVRAEDLLALRIELKNIDISEGSPPKLIAQGNSARLTLHFPPQAITEETFFEAEPPDFDSENAPGSESPNDQPKPPPTDGDELRSAPIRSRIAGESRLVFIVPAGTEFDYTLAGILAACSEFKMDVAANAKPRKPGGFIASIHDLFDAVAIAELAPIKRAGLATQVIGLLRIGSTFGQGDPITLRARQGRGGPSFQPVPERLIDDLAWLPAIKPKPKKPSTSDTSIELPWRLMISPHSGARWRHAFAPATSDATGHTELWHTRMVTPDSSGNEVMPPYPDPRRTIRAIWARSGSGFEAMKPPMQSNWPRPCAKDANGKPNLVNPHPESLPWPGTVPFRMPLDNFDRAQIVHLSSNFSVSGYIPEPIDTRQLMLSSLGGWLDSRGAWDPPGLSVEEWVHRASMARDHYVKVVYRGFLFPFGHRVSLVKVSERKFHSGESGNPAYLRQRYFLIVREKLRTFDDAGFAATRKNDGSVFYANQFPFSQVEILLDSTPDLDKPETQQVEIFGQLMFWPFVHQSAFRFPCVGTDLDGRRVAFDLPMIFMDNTIACPRPHDVATDKLKADFGSAAANARLAIKDYNAKTSRNNADFEGQKFAIAPPMKSGDTSVEAINVIFGGETSGEGSSNQTLINYSDDLSRPIFVPKIVSIEARIGVMANLAGTSDSNTLNWNERYLRAGFNAPPNATPSQDNNLGQVFVDVTGQGKMDFSSQGDRSGGFMQPNLKPKALSRLAGPITSNVDGFIDNHMPAGGGFPTDIGELPLPLLFGCIPLADILKEVSGHLDKPEMVPKFVSEGGGQLETFVNTLVRLFGLVYGLATDPASVGQALIAQAKDTIADQKQQALAYANSLVEPVVQQLNDLEPEIQQVANRLAALVGVAVDALESDSDFVDLPGDVGSARGKVALVRTAANTQVNGVSLPAGFRQSILNLCNTLDQGLEALENLGAFVSAGADLYQALDAIVGDPSGLMDLLSDPDELSTRLTALQTALGDFRVALADFDLINGAVKTSLLNALDDIDEVFETLGDVLAAIATLVEMLSGDELTIRFDWNPEISSFPIAPDDSIFRANDKRGLLVAVEGKVKKNGSSSPKISVVCSLRSFDLVLIAPASFIELQFGHIEFSIDSQAKMDVDVILNEIKFVGPLSFVEVLKDLIPLDGFSDPPYLDISAQGIDAGFDIALPTISCGMLNLSNLALGAGFTVPFIGQPLSVRFFFCTREQPFLLTVYVFGGGGFFAITIDPSGVQILEAAFEFGAAISIDLGVASGGVEVMAGIYFRMENDNATLTGYFRLGGHVDVLGLITASLELYLSLTYESSTGKCTGRAQLTIEVSVFLFSGSVTVSCERKFAGSNGDPSLRQMMGLNSALSLEDELAQISGPDVDYAWRDYLEAFA